MTGDTTHRPSSPATPRVSRRWLYVSRDEVRLLGGEATVTHAPTGLLPEDDLLIEQLLTGEIPPQMTPGDDLDWMIGALLTRAFLQGPVGIALAGAVEQTVVLGSNLELALEIEPPLDRYPWETLCVPAPPGHQPGRPLTLLPSVQLYRLVSGPPRQLRPTLPGPLRILAITGPLDPSSGRRAPEAVLREIQLEGVLEALQAARRQGNAQIHVLELPTLDEIERALQEHPAHVVHFAAGIGPQGLHLTSEPSAHGVEAECRDIARVLVRTGVSMVSLACFLCEREEQRFLSVKLNEAAHLLVSGGAPAVVYLEASMGEAQARVAWARMYHDLATGDRTDPLTAVTNLRHALDRAPEQPAEPAAPAGGRPHLRMLWHSPVAIFGDPPAPLYDPRGAFENPPAERELVLTPGRRVRPAAELRGRCRERRLLLARIKDATGGVLLFGPAGIGKSVLAHRVLDEMCRDGWVTAVVTGRADVERVLEAVSTALLEHCRESGGPLAVEEIAGELGQLDLSWEERFELLGDKELEVLRLVVLLDDFQENLGPKSQLWDPVFAEMLARWLGQRGCQRLLFTCSAPFNLPGDAQARLTTAALEPLSLARTRLVTLGLPRLDMLELSELRHVHELSGGVPRNLVRMNALLGRGRRSYAELRNRLGNALATRGVESLAWWHHEHAQGDRKLAVAIADETTDALDRITWEELDRRPLARKLLIGATVYRRPADELGLAWQVAREHETTEGGPPVGAPAGLPSARATLEDLGLLVKLDAEGEPPLFIVARWVARLLEEGGHEAELDEGHRRAARYWRWRAGTSTRARIAGREVEDLLEARYHHQRGGELELAVSATTAVCMQYHLLSAWSRLEHLCHETLSWLPSESREAAQFHHLLGLASVHRGDYGEAIRRYQRALAVNEELELRAVLAVSFHQLGMVAEERDEEVEALKWYGKALEVEKQVGDLGGQADTCLRMGRITRQRGDDEGARRWYRRSLQMLVDLGDEPLIMAALHRLGGLAGDHGDWSDAVDWYAKVLETRADWTGGHDTVAHFHQLGLAAQDRGDYGEAFLWFRQALEVEDSRGDRLGLACSFRRLGRIAELCGDVDGACDWYRKSVTVGIEQGLKAHVARTTFRIAALTTERGRPADALPLVLRALSVARSLDRDVDVELSWLHHLRRLLGPRSFLALLGQHLDEDRLEELLDLLEV